MLLKGYKIEIINPTCNSYFQSVHCIAHLDEDMGETLTSRTRLRSRSSCTESS